MFNEVLTAVPLPAKLSVAVLVSGSAIVLIISVRSLDQHHRDLGRVSFRLELPRDLSLEQVTDFVRSLTALRVWPHSLLGRDSVVFEVVARPGGIEHRLRVPASYERQLLAQLRAAVPALRAEPADVPALDGASVRRLRPAGVLPLLRTDRAAAFAASFLSGLGILRPERDETVLYQIVAYPLGFAPSAAQRRPASDWPGLTSLQGVLDRLLHGVRRDGRRLVLLGGEPWFAVTVRIAASATSAGRSRHLVNQLIGSLHQLERPGARLRSRRLPQRYLDRLRRAATEHGTHRLVLDATELATLLAWPLGTPTVPGLALAGGRLFPPADVLPQTGWVIGRAAYPSLERPVALRPADALMHLLVTGPTGSGKSTLLLNLITQDLAAGHGLVLIDPNGDLAQAVIEQMPAERAGDLIFIDPADDHAVGLNPLAGGPGGAELVADQLLALLREQAESWGVQLEETLKNTLVLLAASPGMTLVELPAVLLDAGFRRALLAQLDPAYGPTVGEFFARYESWPAGQQAQSASAVLNKVTPLLGRRPIRAMLGQAEPRWAMREVFERAKVLVVSLPTGVVGPLAADLIGSLVVAMAWNAALARAGASATDRLRVTLVIDEVPRFVRGTTNLADLLARARSHGLGLVGAVQHMSQVPAVLRHALLSEARSKVIFPPAAEDAGLFAGHLPGVRADDLLRLGARTAIASLVADGQVAPPVSVTMAPAPPLTGFGDLARTRARAAYARSWAAVEADIEARRQRGQQPGPRQTRRLS